MSPGGTLGGHFKSDQHVITGHISKESSMYPLGNVWTQCLRNLNVSSMCPPGKCPLAPSVRWTARTVSWLMSTFRSCRRGSPLRRSRRCLVISSKAVLRLLRRSRRRMATLFWSEALLQLTIVGDLIKKTCRNVPLLQLSFFAQTEQHRYQVATNASHVFVMLTRFENLVKITYTWPSVFHSQPCQVVSSANLGSWHPSIGRLEIFLILRTAVTQSRFGCFTQVSDTGHIYILLSADRPSKSRCPMNTGRKWIRFISSLGTARVPGMGQSSLSNSYSPMPSSRSMGQIHHGGRHRTNVACGSQITNFYKFWYVVYTGGKGALIQGGHWGYIEVS